MNKKTGNLKIDINKLNPYTNNLLWSLLYFKDLKKQGKKTYLNVAGTKQNIQLKIDNLERRMKKIWMMIMELNL